MSEFRKRGFWRQRIVHDSGYSIAIGNGFYILYSEGVRSVQLPCEPGVDDSGKLVVLLHRCWSVAPPLWSDGEAVKDYLVLLDRAKAALEFKGDVVKIID